MFGQTDRTTSRSTEYRCHVPCPQIHPLSHIYTAKNIRTRIPFPYFMVIGCFAFYEIPDRCAVFHTPHIYYKISGFFKISGRKMWKSGCRQKKPPVENPLETVENPIFCRFCFPHSPQNCLWKSRIGTHRASQTAAYVHRFTHSPFPQYPQFLKKHIINKQNFYNSAQRRSVSA